MHSIFGFVFSVPRSFNDCCVVVVLAPVENGDVDFLLCASLPVFTSNLCNVFFSVMMVFFPAIASKSPHLQSVGFHLDVLAK